LCGRPVRTGTVAIAYDIDDCCALPARAKDARKRWNALFAGTLRLEAPLVQAA